MISIIIPTLNEEKYLPLLLDSIKKQDLKEKYEIIVADAGSTDNTAVIAKNYNCRIARGGLPAKGRNEGAKAARGDLFLFLDAEVLLPDSFLRNLLKEFKAKQLDIASCSLLPIGAEWVPKTIPPAHFLYDIFYNQPALFLQAALPYACSLVLVKKALHREISGFDETIQLSEDHDYARRAAKIGRFGFLNQKLSFFVRRYRKEGILTTSLKYLACNLLNVLGIRIKSGILNYSFEKISDNKEKPAGNILRQALWMSFGPRRFFDTPFSLKVEYVP